MAGVLAEVFCAVDDVPFAPKVVDAVRDALRIDVLLRAGSEVLRLLHTEGLLHASFEHLARLLAQHGVFLAVRFEVLLPRLLHERGHAFYN